MEKSKKQKGGRRPGAGRPPGTPNKKAYTGQAMNIAKLAQDYGPDALRTLAEVMNNGDASDAARVAAANALLDRGFGRPPQSLNVKPEVRHSIDLTKLTDEELAIMERIVAKSQIQIDDDDDEYVPPALEDLRGRDGQA